MYRYCKTFYCSPEEYERRPFKESMWLLEIDRVYTEAGNEAAERQNSM